MKLGSALYAVVVILGTTGCAGLDRVNAKLDMAEQHLSSADKPAYEGKVAALQKVGPMTSLQLEHGVYIDVSEAPVGLAVGDTVRVYKTDNGFVAHIWKIPAEESPSPESEALARAISPR
jgi:hypothetical protein